MKCKTCNYSLWNNTKGQCPECGTPFKPSDFEFKPGTVRFHCPHCAQQYFGTDARGHLEPRAFTCVKCQQPVEMDSMPLSPEVGVRDEDTQTGELPWSDESLGLFARWWKTTWKSMIRPQEIGKGIRPGSPVAAAWWYAMFTNAIISLVSWGSLLAFVLVVVAIASAKSGGGGPPLWAMGLGMGMLGLFTLIMYPLLILLWGACSHLILRIGVNKPAHTLKHTYATLCYASGANFVNSIPCVGSYAFLGGIWWMVSAAIGLRYSQKVPAGKAVAAAIIPPLLVGLTCFIGYFGFIAAMIGTANAAAARAGAAAVAASASADMAFTKSILMALNSASTNNNGWPNHIAELVLDNSLTTSSFTLSGSGTKDSVIPVLSTTLNQIILLPASEEKRAKERLKTLEMPPVYRFGDFIFSYQGVPASSPNQDLAQLWLVFSFADPASPQPQPFVSPFVFPGAPSTPSQPAAQPAMQRNVQVGLVNGAVKTILVADFPAELVKQNALRALFKLPPIPAPESLKQWQAPIEPPPGEPAN